MRFLTALVFFPLDLVFLTVDAWILTFGIISRLIHRDKDQPCPFCRGDDHSSTPHPVRSVLKYRNAWLVRWISPCIRFKRDGGKRLAYCKREGGFTRAPAWVPLIAIGLVAFWFFGISAVLGLASSDPNRSVVGNIWTFFNPGRKARTVDFLEIGEARHNPERAERYYLSGVRNFDKREYARALVDFRNAIQSDPSDPKLHFQLARALFATGQAVQGEQSLRKTLEYDPRHAEALLMLAEVLERKEQRAEALQYARRALAEAPDNRQAVRLNAALLAAEGQNERVRELVDHLLALDAENPDSLAFVANIELAVFRNPETARTLFTRALEINPDHIDALMGMIPLYAQANDVAKVEEILAKVLGLKPDHLPALRYQADIAMARYGLGAGLRAYSGLMNRFAGDPGVRLRYAELLIQSGNLSEGKKLLLQLTGSRVVPVERAAYWLLARMHAQIRLHEEAAEYARQTLLRAPGNREVLAFIGQQQLAMNRPGEARIQFEAALAGRRDDPVLATLLSQAMVGMGQTSEAIAYLVDFLKQNPDADLVRRRLVEIRMQSPQWLDALEDTIRLQEKYPEEPTFKNNLAFLLARAGRDLPKALALAESLLAQFPDNPMILDTHAFVLAALGRHEEALKQYEAALARAGGVSAIRLHYARSLAAVGRTQDARREAEAALLIDPSFPDAEEARQLVRQLTPGA